MRRMPSLCTPHPLFCRAECGFLLFEVLAAVIVVVVLGVSLATAAQAVCAASARVRTDQFTLGQDFGVEAGAEASSGKGWSWGPHVSAIGWSKDGQLEIQVAPGDDSAGCRKLGVWIDGWFIGEFETTNGGKTLLPVRSWQERAGRTGASSTELIVRVREESGSWGPPWRMALIGTASDSEKTVSSGAASGGDACTLDRAGEDSSFPDSGAVVHVPFFSTSSLEVRGIPCTMCSRCEGLFWVLQLAEEGEVKANLDGVSQSWLAEKGRSLDVYF